MLHSINPATEELYGALEEYTPQEIAAAVARARADRAWSLLPVETRVHCVEQFLQELRERREAIARVMTGEIGKPIQAGRHEIDLVCKRIEAYCRQIPGAIADELVSENEQEKNVVQHEPLGVIAIISPWNAPIFVSLASLIPALLCGNRVVWKPSEYASFTAQELLRTFAAVQNKGLPAMSIEAVFGSKDIGACLLGNEIDGVVLTGSLKAGQDVMARAAHRLLHVTLELGGKDPAIVLDDADIGQAAREIVKSATMYTGQVCFGVERVYCMASVYDQFVASCIGAMRNIVVGDPFDEATTMGPFSVEFQMQKYFAHLEDAVQKGAHIVFGGQRLQRKGYFVEPCVLTGVTHEMRIMCEETFGPVVPIMCVTSVDEAIHRANDSDYGLTASIWTRSLDKGERIARLLEAGTVEINRHGMSKAGLPWGGFKKSGIGRLYSNEGIRTAFTNQKHVWTIK